MLGSEVRGTAGGGRGRRAALSRDGRDGHHSKQQAQTASPRTARNRREEMNHKRATARGDEGTSGQGDQGARRIRGANGPGQCASWPRPRRQGSWIPPPPANRRAASRSHPAHATCPGPPFPPQAWTDQRRGQAQGANRNWLLMRLATKTNSLPPPSPRPHRPDRRRPRPFLSPLPAMSSVKTTNKPTSRRRATVETRPHLRLMMNLSALVLGTWALQLGGMER